MSAPLSEVQLRAQAAAVRRKLPTAGRIGFHTKGPWTGPARIRVGEEEADVVFCDSALAVREALVSHENEDRLLLVLTECEENDLGDDVLARLAKRRLLRGDPWRDVMTLFRAREVDPRISRERWLAQALLEAAPSEGPPPAPSGVLDAELAWGVILAHLGFGSARPDARALLEWTLDEERTARFQAASSELRTACAAWMGESAGGVAARALFCVEAGRSRDALAIGLACRVIFDPSGESEPRLRDAGIRLEPLVGAQAIEPTLGVAWADAAEAVARGLRGSDREATLKAVFDRAVELLDELRLPDQVWRSSVLPLGFEQRLEHSAAALGRALTDGSELSGAEAAGALALAHEVAPASGRRGQAVAMSLRLLRWLSAGVGSEPGSLAEAVERYAGESSFADWAREALADGDPAERVSAAYAALVQKATQRRERENQQFARMLSEATAAGRSTDVLPIESVLTEFVAPLARTSPVLLLVLDGMSGPVYQELAADLIDQGWCELVPEAAPKRARAIAALPTLTEVSRTSLFCGALRRGTSNDEQAGFAAHLELLSASRSGQPPALFHKGDLAAPGGVGLADAVRAEVARSSRQVVGVVLNAIDDFLSKGDQIHPRWGVVAVRPLESLLEIARAAGRVVVFTSDHGHVLERGSSLRREVAESSRCRTDDGRVDEGEIALRGPRVVGLPGGSFIAAWSEQLRYGAKQNGYHGGASPQEVVVPVAVFAPTGVSVEGWVEVPSELPSWWDAEGPPAVVPPDVVAPGPPRRGQIQLPFSGEAPAPPVQAAWIGALFASPVYGTQKRLASRSAPPDDRVKTSLLALEARGGKLTRAALARAVGLPLVRLGGFLAALRRVLNVEGYPVLSLDDETETVELNRELLIVQFGIRE